MAIHIDFNMKTPIWKKNKVTHSAQFCCSWGCLAHIIMIILFHSSAHTWMPRRCVSSASLADGCVCGWTGVGVDAYSSPMWSVVRHNRRSTAICGLKGPVFLSSCTPLQLLPICACAWFVLEEYFTTLGYIFSIALAKSQRQLVMLIDVVNPSRLYLDYIHLKTG